MKDKVARQIDRSACHVRYARVLLPSGARVSTGIVLPEFFVGLNKDCHGN